MVKKALVIGINDYGSPQNNLPSCIADAKTFGQFLQSKYGFREIRSLFDAQATRAKVEQELDWLFADAREDSHLVFYYSGHGYTKYMQGNMEEFLVLRDGLWQDDALSARTRKLQSGRLLVILDSCFSGGMLKLVTDPSGAGEEVEVAKTKVWTGMPPDEVEKAFTPDEQSVLRVKRFGMSHVVSPRSIAKVLRPEAFPMPVESPVLSKEAEAALKTFDLPGLLSLTEDAVKAGGVEDEPNQLAMQGLLISACLPDETAAASTSKTKGLSAFTYALLETYPTVGGYKPADEVLKATAAYLQSLKFRQTPMILEARDPGDLKHRSFITFDAASTLMQADAKFWGAFAAVLPPLISAVAPTILNAVTGRRKGLPEDLMDLSDPEQMKGLGGFFRGIARTLPDVVRTVGPLVMTALRKGQIKTNDTILAGVGDVEPEETAKFWGALATILPSVVSAVAPMVINALNGRGKSGEWEPLSDDEFATPEQEKIWWNNSVDIMQGCFPGLSPVIRNAMRGRTKGFSTTGGSDGPVADEKFWGAVAAILPSLVQTAAPILIDVLSGAQRKADGMAMPARQAAYGGTNGQELQGDAKFWGAIAQALPSIITAVTPVIRSVIEGQKKGFQEVEATVDEKNIVDSIIQPFISACAPILMNALMANQRKEAVQPVFSEKGWVSDEEREVLKDAERRVMGGFV